jgi:hypothetical protein
MDSRPLAGYNLSFVAGYMSNTRIITSALAGASVLFISGRAAAGAEVTIGSTPSPVTIADPSAETPVPFTNREPDYIIE